MKLTIGMIVKNEEKWLDKCLSAIKPILDNVESELIITDTGSTDRTVEIAKKYTDKVLHFDWCDDFSVVRNFGLEKAKGEWFMMLDADDIFRCCDNIISFFNSGDYKKYNAATYISRNIVKGENGNTYSDILAPRMVMLHPETRYEGEIHESLNTFSPPYKNINDIADHYGYLYENEEARLRKFKRNISLLLKRYEKEKNSSPMLYIQLYEAYLSVDKTDKALRYLDEGIILAQKMNSIVLVTLLFHKMSYYYTEKDYNAALNIAVEYFKINKKIRPYSLSTDGEIYAIRARSLCELGRYGEAVDEYKKFFNIYKDIIGGKIATYDAYLISNFLCSEINWLPLFNEFLVCCIKTEKYNTAEAYLTSFSFAKYLIELTKIVELVSLEITVLEHFDYKGIRRYADKLDKNAQNLLGDMLLIRLYKAVHKDKILSAVTALDNEEMTGKADALMRCFDECESNDPEKETEVLVQVVSRSFEISKISSNELLSVSADEFIIRFSKLSKIFGTDGTSPVIQASAAIFNAEKLRGERRYRKCISEIKRAIELYQPLAGIMQEYSRLVVGEYEESVKAPQPQNEMRRLAGIIKRNIRGFISSGDIVAAEKTLSEYVKLVPDDPDTNELFDAINKMK